MRVVIIGAGHVGLASGVCLAEWGNEVHWVDRDPRKVELLRSGVSPVHENRLAGLLRRNLQSGRLSFAGEPGPEFAGARAVFLCVDTPAQDDDGAADLSRIFRATRDMAAWLDPSALVVVKSTVPVGTARRLREILRELRPEAGIEVASNPEFLRASYGVADFQQPARVVIGAESDRARGVLHELYRPLSRQEVPIVTCTSETAELVKQASNAFLSIKVAFVNEMADLCERTGADVRDLARGVGLDERIGAGYLRPGPGFGGPCLPKDVAALVHLARDAGAPAGVVEAALESNRLRPKRIADRLANACGGSLEGRTVAILGLAFKADTDSLRDSPSLAIIAELLGRGAAVRAHDPLAVNGHLPSGVRCFEDAYEAAAGADLVVIGTAWSQYAELDAERLRRSARRPVIADLHNLYDEAAMRARGFDYIGIGRPGLRPRS